MACCRDSQTGEDVPEEQIALLRGGEADAVQQ